MIDRPDNLAIVKVNFMFNGLKIKELEIDLEHINSGSANKARRSQFDKETVASICEEFFSDQTLKPIGEKTFGTELCRYFKLKRPYRKKHFRMVICHCSDKPNTLGVITLFKEA